LSFAAEHKGLVEACVAKPGFITVQGDYLKLAFGTVLRWTGMATTIDVTEISAALLNQAINGFEKEPLTNDDLVRIGRGLERH
jgi:hypothetical protein